MMISNAVARKYIDSVKVLLPLYKKEERLFISDLTNDVNEFMNSHPDASLEDLEMRFGSPFEISQSYIGSIDVDVLIKRLSLAKMMRRVIAVLIAIMLIGLCVFSGLMYKGYQDTKNTIVTNEETVITD